MNASTALARVVVDELVRCGVRDAVLAPGSRSAALAIALADADAAGRIRLHVRVDERSAGFLALGLAKGSHRAVPVVTTSGTAVANLHPAVLEAFHAGVPVVVLSADRPAELRGTGANQTTDQVKIFGGAVRAYAEIPAADVVPASGAPWRATVGRVLADAGGGAYSGAGRSGGGPAHLNLCFRDPLLPGDPDDAGPGAVLPGRAGGAPWVADERGPAPAPVTLEPGPRTVVLAGDDAGPPARLLAQRADWPLLAEPSSGSRTGTHPVATYRLLLGLPELGGRIERVLVYGHPTLSRPATALLARDDVEVIAVGPGPYPDPGHRVSRVLGAATVQEPDDRAWIESWQAADRATLTAIDAVLAGEPGLTPHAVARAVSAAVPPEGLLVVGSSNPVRDLDLMALAHPVGERRMVMANRGLSGIDGTVSTAVGAALGRRSSRSLAYIGDLTFLHDSNGLLLGPDEPRPDLTIVVASDDGGSIFGTLEQGAPEYSGAFERVFGTPTGADLAGLCAAMGVPHTRVDDAPSLDEALSLAPSGVEVVEARIDRRSRRDLDERVRAAARLH
ncbi:MAG: 2-succinyl-5-enolpyruvyl-6-hydroxy-3-cyclohexene-1-carboxylic-acid synthase [Nocardioidaceae bacterium]